MRNKYFIKLEHYDLGLETDWKEVTVEEFIQAERAAGFWSVLHEHGKSATGGFSGAGMRGRVEYILNDMEKPLEETLVAS